MGLGKFKLGNTHVKNITQYGTPLAAETVFTAPFDCVVDKIHFQVDEPGSEADADLTIRHVPNGTAGLADANSVVYTLEIRDSSADAITAATTVTAVPLDDYTWSGSAVSSPDGMILSKGDRLVYAISATTGMADLYSQIEYRETALGRGKYPSVNKPATT